MPSRRKTSRTPPSAVRTSLRRLHSPPASPLNLFPRLSSEPLLPGLPSPSSPAPPADAIPSLPRNQTWTELFTSSAHHSLPSSPFNREVKASLLSWILACGDDRKGVVSVSVEGSPGPVRTMVRLGATVDETIQQVIEQYRREGRSPRFDDPSCSSTSMFDLHHSHFSLQTGLDGRERIGEVGSRSFYLRKSRTSGSGGEVVGDGGADVDGWKTVSDFRAAAAPPAVLASYVAKRMRKIGRRTKKIWTLLGCMSCE